jgi:putative addiction module component (TIGR02574 family)
MQDAEAKRRLSQSLHPARRRKLRNPPTPLRRSLKQRYPSFMSTIVEVEKLALDLPEQERAALAANLLDSLPGILSDEDEGVAEALRRDAEIEADPTSVISLAELDSQIRGRRG